MQFTTAQFLLFLAAAAALYRVLPARLRPLLLVAASYAFYFTWQPLMAVLLLGSTALVYAAALRIGSASSESAARMTAFAVTAVLVLYLAGFKFAQALQAGWLMPLGISYYTFKLISYILDVYRRQMAPERNFIRMAAFTAFFPQIVAGPIQRGETLLPQLKEAAPARGHVAEGLSRILLGFLRKLVVADNLARLVDYGFAPGAGHPQCWLAFYLFPLQLYCDFAGLTDIAVGAALLFGIRSPENFARPFFGASISEFWRRWHMSLTEWLRDYVFMPLRMATRNWAQAGLAFSIALNMFLIAVWHSFSLGFVVFGLLNALYLVVDALSLPRRRHFYRRHAGTERLMNWLGPVATYHMMALACIFVRAATLGQALHVTAGLLAAPAGMAAALAAMLAPPNHHVWIAFPALVAAELLAAAGERLFAGPLPSMRRPVRWSLYATVAVSILFLMAGLLVRGSEVKPFVYAMF